MEMNRAIPDGIMAYAGHPYVKTIAKNGDIYYTDEFYTAMYEKITKESMTYVEAYNALGFETSILTEDRAYSAGKRAVQRARNRRAFERNPAEFDSDTPFEEMMSRYLNGSMTREELYANMAARLIVLEEIHKELKKTISSLPGEKKK